MLALAGPRHITSNIEGDVNVDGEVTIADINVVIDAILHGGGDPRCDVNGDKEIDVSDIDFVIERIN